jgi:hypothetical protein
MFMYVRPRVVRNEGKQVGLCGRFVMSLLSLRGRNGVRGFRRCGVTSTLLIPSGSLSCVVFAQSQRWTWMKCRKRICVRVVKL